MDKNTLLAIRYVCFVLLILIVLYFSQNKDMSQISSFLSFLAGIILPTTNATNAAVRTLGL